MMSYRTVRLAGDLWRTSCGKKNVITHKKGSVLHRIPVGFWFLIACIIPAAAVYSLCSHDMRCYRVFIVWKNKGFPV